MKLVKVLVTQSCLTLCYPMDCPMEFPRQEYWSGLPFPLPGDLPNPGIEPASPLSAGLQADSLLVEPLGKPLTFSQVLLFSHSVMSGSLRPHGLQPTMLPCSSPSKYLKCVTMSP